MIYREKIYSYYISARNQKIVPDSVDELKPRKPYLEKIVKTYFPKDKKIKILEIGAGHGAFGYFMHLHGYTDYVGIDGSIEQVEASKKLGIKGIKYGNLIEELKNTQDGSIDLIIAFDVIEHFTKQELSDLIDDIFRVLKKDGAVITHQPNAEGVFGNMIRYGDYTHEQSFTRESISQIFLSSGFSKVESFEDVPIAHGLKSGLRNILWRFLARPLYCFLVLVETGYCSKDAIFTQNFLSVTRK